MKTMHSVVALLRIRPESIVGRLMRLVVRRDDLLCYPTIGRGRIRAFTGTAWGRLFQTY